MTDADLALGWLEPESFLGGEMRLDRELAQASLARLATRLGLDPIATAAGIAEVVCENMAAAARVHIAEKGHDPRRFVMVATGGAGPVHAVEVAFRLGIRRLLLPIAAGAGSCLGLLAAPARADRSWTRQTLIAEVDWPAVRESLAMLRDGAAKELEQAGGGSSVWRVVAEMRYAGQGHTVTVPLAWSIVEHGDSNQLRENFESSYRALYGRIVPNGAPQVVTWRLTGRADREVPRFRWAKGAVSTEDPVADRVRSAYRPDQAAYSEMPVYQRYSLSPGTRLEGPLIFEERESTLVVARPATVTVLKDLTVQVDLPS